MKPQLTKEQKEFIAKLMARAMHRIATDIKKQSQRA
jgi:hypothetical protein